MSENRDQPGKLDGVYECMQVHDNGEYDGIYAVLKRGYRKLEIVGSLYDFTEFDRGVRLLEGRRYRITIEEIRA